MTQDNTPLLLFHPSPICRTDLTQPPSKPALRPWAHRLICPVRDAAATKTFRWIPSHKLFPANTSMAGTEGYLYRHPDTYHGGTCCMETYCPIVRVSLTWRVHPLEADTLDSATRFHVTHQKSDVNLLTPQRLLPPRRLKTVGNSVFAVHVDTSKHTATVGSEAMADPQFLSPP
jgi:hypothetical protein